MAEGSPLISVVVSTFNRAKLLQKALQSIQNQSLKDFECIVVDDCGTDTSEEVVNNLQDPRFKYLRTDKNYGHDSHPKNVGIKEATGTYVAFLDDDDCYRPDALKILSTYLDDSGADVVYGDYLIGGKPGWSVNFSPSGLHKMNYISMCVVMVRREALVKVGGFDEDVPKFKDWNLWIRLQKAGFRFLHVPIIVSEVSTQEDSISNKHKVQVDENGQYLPTFFDPVDCTIYPKNTCLGETPKLRVALYTLTWNRLELTKAMYESLAYAGHDFDWFVIDQGSTDGTVEWLKTTSAKVQYNEKNVGLAEGWNQAVKFIKDSGQYDVIVKVDNDAKLLTQDWLKAMVALYERNSTLILSPYIEKLENTPGGVMRQREDGGPPYFIINETVLGSVPNIGGIVFAAPIELFKEWKFNPTYQGNKDYLLCQYAKNLGCQCFYMEEYRAEHQLGSSGQKDKYPQYFSDSTNDSTK